MRKLALVLLALASVLASLAGCTSAAVTGLDQARAVTLPSLGTPPLVPYVSGRVVLEQRAPCHAQGDNEQLPDPVCTPGAVGEVQVDLVCNPRFQAWHRVDVTRPRLLAMRAYGVRIEDSGVTEYDHRIPLSLGGANATSNLWPQRSDIPNAKPPYRNSKDSIEYSVWYAVCRAHTVPLAQAQQAFMGDWRDALRVLKVRAIAPPAGVARD
jgi:hypothetical protein